MRSQLAEQSGLVAKVESNRFELERRCPMGLRPESFGMRVVARHPWSQLLG